jgi:DNA (cytosine-5)-methyltransferase 1
MAALLGALVELGYGVGYRVLDARYFGVPQRRRRVFILGDSLGGRAGAERAAEVLSVGSRCRRHPPAGIEAGSGTAAGAYVGTLDTSLGHHGGAWGDQAVAAGHIVPTLRVGGRAQGAGSSYDNTPIIVGPSPDAGRDGATDGLAGRLDDRQGVANALQASAGHHGHSSPRGDGSDNLVIAHTLTAPDARHRVVDGKRQDVGSYHQRDRVYADLAPALDAYGDTASDAPIVWSGDGVADDPLLPLGLDSHRYRCCGNGVVADVAEWIGRRLMDAL